MSRRSLSLLFKSLLTTATLFSFQLAFPAAAKAQTSPWTGVCVSEENQDVATLQGLQCLLANVLSVSLTLLGIIGFVMLVIGAIRWQVSGGNSQHVEKSKQTMTYALIGLIVALSSFIILNLVAEFTGVKSILNFVIPDSNTQW
jgi:hypothetical protein